MEKNIYSSLKRVLVFLVVLSLLVANRGFFVFVESIYANDKENNIATNENIKNLTLEEQVQDNTLFGWSGGSSPSGNNRIISSEFEYANLTYSSKEDKSKFYYTDDYFKNDSTIYNNHLSTMSIELAISGIGNYVEENKDKYANLKDVFSKMGFVNITPNDDFLQHPEDNSMGSVCANKHIYLKDESGNVQDYNIMAIAMRSANYSNEWLSNFTLGSSGDHQGFSESRDIVFTHLNTFYNEHKDDFGNIPIKIWIVGYSRGAAVANMLAGKVTDECASFNTTKENIYCYTLGTPRGALISNHTTVPLDSYTNIHNVLTDADFIQLLVPPALGFGRYGVDHKVPTYVNDKVHNATERAEKQNRNATYMTKYNNMLSRLRQIDPRMFSEINDLKMYELTLFDMNTFQYLIFNRLGDTPFTETSDEREYYQANEFVDSFMNGILKYTLECNFAGTDYGTISGRERYYQKYQDILLRLFKIFYINSDSKTVMERIQQNAMSNLMTMFSAVFILDKLVYCEGMPPDRTHCPLDETAEPENMQYFNAYERMEPVYQVLFTGAFSDNDYNFIMSHHRDLTDFLLDLLNADFRAPELPKKSALGTIANNTSLLASEHMASIYLSWLQTEDDYFDTAPSNTLKYDGIKTLTFTNLSDSKIEVYNENNNKICEYIIDTSNTVTCNDIIDTEYVHVAKSYNPEGLELRLATDKNYKAIVTTNDKSLGQVVYREYFLDDAEFYRKEINFGEIYLKSYENIEITFNSSSLTKVFSCYNSEDLRNFKAGTFTKVENHGANLAYGYDYYTYSNMPNIYKTIKISADSIKEGVSGDYAHFAGTKFEDQDSNVESIDLDTGDVYKKINLLSNKNAVLHVVNDVNSGYGGVKTYNNYNDTVKTETDTNYNKANIYYIGKDIKHSVLHTLEVEDSITAEGLFGSANVENNLATSSDVNIEEPNSTQSTSQTENIEQTEETEQTEGTESTEELESLEETTESSETSESLETNENETTNKDNTETETVETENSEIAEAYETTTIDETTETDETNETNETTESQESTTIDDTVNAFTDTEDEIIATESELQSSESQDELFGDGTANRLYYVSVPTGYATNATGTENKYYNTGDDIKIYITKEDVGKKISSISIYNGDTLVETIENVTLNQAIDYQVSDFDIRVVANYENKKYAVNFTTQAEGTFYYYNGQSFVEGTSGNEYEYGTKIKFTAPMTYDGREFYGWTLKNSSGRYLNQKEVDTPKVIDESTDVQSTYVLELKDYAIDILANYKYKTYTLTLQIDGSKGVVTPSDASLVYNALDDFNNAKTNVGVHPTGSKAFRYWNDGIANYVSLSDYNWQYKKDVVLTAIFEQDTPSGGGGDNGDSRGSGGGGGGGGGGPIPSTNVPETTFINNESDSAINIDTKNSTWVYDPVANKFKLNINVNGNTQPAMSGFYTINSIETMIVNSVQTETVVSNTYCFDTYGNMVTGWVNTSNSKWYFFENAKTSKEGSMVTGWKEIQGSWYFFAINGVLIVNTMTPDGYLVDIDGKWIK